MNPDFETLYIFGADEAGCEVAWLSEHIWGAAMEKKFIIDDKKDFNTPAPVVAAAHLTGGAEPDMMAAGAPARVMSQRKGGIECPRH